MTAHWFFFLIHLSMIALEAIKYYITIYTQRGGGRSHSKRNYLLTRNNQPEQ